MEELIQARKPLLIFYSPYNFIREINTEAQFSHCIVPQLSNNSNTKLTINIESQIHQFLFQKLAWDTQYFGINTYKLNYVLFKHQDLTLLTQACIQFKETLFSDKAYLFIEIPSEDTLLIQALGLAGFTLIETRLTYYRGNLDTFNEPRYPVRKATENDTENLMEVARSMRNNYDRFHADTIFDVKIADEFLATYIQQSLKGFADIVLTSDELNTPSDSFLTARYLKNEWSALNVPVSKMVLSAVSATTNKGWYKKLVSEMTYHLKQEGANYIFMNTQSTNRAVFYTWEKLGFSLGCTTHILSINNITQKV